VGQVEWVACVSRRSVRLSIYIDWDVSAQDLGAASCAGAMRDVEACAMGDSVTWFLAKPVARMLFARRPVL